MFSNSRETFLPETLVAFLAVSELGTVRAAAKSLGLVQTAVTRRIQALEGATGATLFLRSRRGMVLTEPGRTLVSYARRMKEIEAEALALMRGESSQRQEQIVIASPSSLASARVVPKLAGILSSNPGVAIQLCVSDDRIGVELLKRNEVDIALLPAADVPLEFESRRLEPEIYVAVGPTAWKKRQFESIVRSERIVDFDSRDDLTFDFLAEHNLLDIAQRNRHFVNNTHVLAELVAQGVGYTVLSIEFAKALFATSGALANIGGARTHNVSIALAWYARQYPTRAFKEIMTALK